MAKVITGTASMKKVAVVRGQKDVRQVRCPKCKYGLAVAVPDGKGGTKQRCNSCQAEFVSTVF